MKNVFVALLIISFTFLACSNKEESAHKMLDKVLTLQQVGKYDEANIILQNIIRNYPETKIAADLKKVLASKEETEGSKAVFAAEQKASEPASAVIPYTPPPRAGDAFPEHPTYTKNPFNNRQELSDQSGNGNIQKLITDNQLSRGSNRGPSVDLERAVSFGKQANEYRRASIDLYKTDPRRADQLSRLADQYEQKANEYQKRYDKADQSEPGNIQKLKANKRESDLENENIRLQNESRSQGFEVQRMQDESRSQEFKIQQMQIEKNNTYWNNWYERTFK